MPASLDGALIRNTEAEPQERRDTMQRKRAVVPEVGKAKGKDSGGLRMGLGHRGQADEDQAARDLYLGERRNLRENGWLSLCWCRADNISLLFSPSKAVVEPSGGLSRHLEDL